MLFWAMLFLLSPADLALRNNEITVKAGAAFGGAISSIKWHGKEFINSADHGRELQSALSFDGYGECFNPTEGGSQDDGSKPTTSSHLFFGRIDSGTLQTRTDMAFWLAPGQPYHRDCGAYKGLQVATNEIDSRRLHRREDGDFTGSEPFDRLQLSHSERSRFRDLRNPHRLHAARVLSVPHSQGRGT